MDLNWWVKSCIFKILFLRNEIRNAFLCFYSTDITISYQSLYSWKIDNDLWRIEGLLLLKYNNVLEFSQINKFNSIFFQITRKYSVPNIRIEESFSRQYLFLKTKFHIPQPWQQIIIYCNIYIFKIKKHNLGSNCTQETWLLQRTRFK